MGKQRNKITPKESVKYVMMMMMMYQEAHYTAARVPHLSSLLLTYFRLK